MNKLSGVKTQCCRLPYKLYDLKITISIFLKKMSPEQIACKLAWYPVSNSSFMDLSKQVIRMNVRGLLEDTN